MRYEQNIQIGSTVPRDGSRQPIHATGPYAGHPRWYALMVASQKESAAEGWLRLRGVDSFHPITTRTTTTRGRRVTIKSRYLPGYVFARFPSRPITNRVFTCPFITDALRVQSGAWGIIVPNDIRKLHSMRDVDAAHSKAIREAAQVRVGDKVLIPSGLPGEGNPIEVLEIVAGKARIRLHMFGSERDVVADVDRLHKLG